ELARQSCSRSTSFTPPFGRGHSGAPVLICAKSRRSPLSPGAPRRLRIDVLVSGAPLDGSACPRAPPWARTVFTNEPLHLVPLPHDECQHVPSAHVFRARERDNSKAALEP